MEQFWSDFRTESASVAEMLLWSSFRAKSASMAKNRCFGQNGAKKWLVSKNDVFQTKELKMAFFQGMSSKVSKMTGNGRK